MAIIFTRCYTVRPRIMSFCVVMSFAISMCGCMTITYNRLYEGPPRTPGEVAILNAGIFERVYQVDGLPQTYDAKDKPYGLLSKIEVLPGQHTLTVSHLKSATELVDFKVDAGKEYTVTYCLAGLREKIQVLEGSQQELYTQRNLAYKGSRIYPGETRPANELAILHILRKEALTVYQIDGLPKLPDGLNVISGYGGGTRKDTPIELLPGPHRLTVMLYASQDSFGTRSSVFSDPLYVDFTAEAGKHYALRVTTFEREAFTAKFTAAVEEVKVSDTHK